MPPAIPPLLAPYVEHPLSHSSQTLLTSVLATPCNWLVVRFISAVLNGVEEDLVTGRARTVQGNVQDGMKVVFVSILRPFELWTELGRKIGLDFTALLGRKVAYVNGLDAPFPGSTPTSLSKLVVPKSFTLEDLNASIDKAVQSISEAQSPESKPVVIIDGIDYLLACQPELGPLEVQQFLSSLHERTHSIVLTCSADTPLLHSVDPSSTPLEQEHGMMVRMLAHQSSIIMQLRPLETGHAKDVSGVVRVSKGGSYNGEEDELADGEWLYQVRGDGQVKIWSRGD